MLFVSNDLLSFITGGSFFSSITNSNFLPLIASNIFLSAGLMLFSLFNTFSYILYYFLSFSTTLLVSSIVILITELKLFNETFIKQISFVLI